MSYFRAERWMCSGSITQTLTSSIDMPENEPQDGTSKLPGVSSLIRLPTKSIHTFGCKSSRDGATYLAPTEAPGKDSDLLGSLPVGCWVAASDLYNYHHRDASVIGVKNACSVLTPMRSVNKFFTG